MAKNDILQGGDLMLFNISGTSSTSASTIAAATNHTLSVSTELSDTSHKDIVGSWKSSEVKSFSWEATTENLFTLDPAGKGYYDLFDFMTNKTKLTVYLDNKSSAAFSTTNGWTPNLANGTDYLSGQVIISNISLNAPNGDNATYTVTFTGVGPLTHVKVS